MHQQPVEALFPTLQPRLSRRGVMATLALLARFPHGIPAEASAAPGIQSPATGSSFTPTASAPLPPAIAGIMQQPRYAEATWSLLVTDVKSGEILIEHNADQRMFTASVRKLFSVGLALDQLGADHRFITPVFRTGEIDAQGRLDGDLILVASADLVFGGRVTDDSVAYTNFDHNDANGLGTAILTPQDPLRALDDLAQQVQAVGIQSIKGDVFIDDRLFTSFRVPNQNLLITPIVVNENLVDVIVTPTAAGEAASVEWRPQTAAFGVEAEVMTSEAGSAADVTRSGNGKVTCIGEDGCSGSVRGEIPADYRAALSGEPTLVQTFQIEDPAAFARTAFIEALQRAGIQVNAPLVRANDASRLPAAGSYLPDTRVAEFTSPVYAEYAKLILKVSLNLGANLSLMLFALTQGATTIEDALEVDRQALIDRIGLAPEQFAFPTNGSGTPDSEASARAVVQMLQAMAGTDVAAAYRAGLPILGVDGSLAAVGVDLPGRGHVLAKTGTTIEGGAILAQNLAGYIDAASGRELAFALLLNDAGAIQSIEDVVAVLTDEATITSLIYESF